MSLLEQQMQELKLRQRKASFLKVLLGLLDSKIEYKDEKPSKEEIEADKEISGIVMNFIQDQINHIENGTPMPHTSSAEGQFTPEEVSYLKDMVTRFVNRTLQTDSANAGEASAGGAPGIFRPQQPTQSQQPQRKGNKDILTFAMEHKHLNGKRVIVHTKQGKVGGVVTGADMPNLWVKTDTGHVVPVLPENLTLE